MDAPDAGDGAEQDAGGAALRRAQGALPGQRRRVLRLVLRLLPARGVPAGDRHLHREGLVGERRDRQAAPLGDPRAADPARRDRGGERLGDLRPRRARDLRLDARLRRDRDVAAARPLPAPAGRHAVRAQRHRLPPRHLSRAGRRGRGVPAVRGRARAARRVLRRRGGIDRGDRPPARQGGGAPEARDAVPGQPLRRHRADPGAGAGRHPGGAPGASRRAARAEQAAGGAAARAAHALRSRDARADGLLPRGRELLALARRPQRRGDALHAVRLLPGRPAGGDGREPHQRSPDRGDVPRRPRPQGGAGRVRLPAALGARQPAAALRGVGGARAAAHLRVGDAGRVRAREVRRRRGRADHPAHRPGRSQGRGAAGRGPGGRPARRDPRGGWRPASACW